MSLHNLLRQRAEEDNPIRVGVIGAGKFGSMYLAQARRTPGIHVMGVADLAPERAREALRRVGVIGRLQLDHLGAGVVEGRPVCPRDRPQCVCAALRRPRWPVLLGSNARRNFFVVCVFLYKEE